MPQISEKDLFQKGKDIPIVKNRERGGIEICEGSVEERIYLTIKVTIDVTGIFSAEEEQEKEDGAGLSILEQLNNQK